MTAFLAVIAKKLWQIVSEVTAVEIEGLVEQQKKLMVQALYRRVVSLFLIEPLF
jgi:hypothetical protein